MSEGGGAPAPEPGTTAGAPGDPGPSAPAPGERPLADRVRAFLARHSAMTLATTGPEGVWASTVFYAVADDEHDLSLVFFSHERSRHGRNLGELARAAAAVNEQHFHWRTIQGVQLEGTVAHLHGDEQAEALQLIVERFPWLSDMATSADEQERKIAARLTTTSVYRLVPDRAVLTDNMRFFGSREELLLR